MYLAEVRLCNWRSYADAAFQFPPPSPKKPLILIGAMNGHGKTSFLVALYLGLFGRFGLRHAEGFSLFQEENIDHYREAIAKFRRNDAQPEDPTTVELVFAPSHPDDATREVRLIRR